MGKTETNILLVVRHYKMIYINKVDLQLSQSVKSDGKIPCQHYQLAVVKERLAFASLLPPQNKTQKQKTARDIFSPEYSSFEVSQIYFAQGALLRQVGRLEVSS